MNEPNTIARIRRMMADMPLGCANLATEDQNPKIPIVKFKITPTNSVAASIYGFVADSQGIDFTVGLGTGGEIPEGKEERFFQICQAVFRSSFLEELVFSRRGSVIKSKIELSLDGKRIVLGGHQLFWWLFPKRTKKTIAYAPYF